MLKTLKQLLCSHSAVEVIRWHPDIVPKQWKDKLLFTDIHNVSNFVRCCDCEKIFKGAQKQHLFETQK